MNGLPTIRIDLEGVRYGVIHAFTDKADEIRDYTARAIDASMGALIEGGLEKAIVATVDRVVREALYEGMKDAVRVAIEEYFETGEGQRFVRNAIVEHLKDKP